MKQFIIILFSLYSYFLGFCQQPIFIVNGGTLYSLDLNNCSSRVKGTGIEFGDIAFTPNGKLWGYNGGSLYKVDTTNAEDTFIGNTSIGGVSLVDLNDSVLLTEFEDSLWGINISTLKAYNIGYIGYSAAGDLTWYDNDLYMTTGNQLIRIILNSTYTAIVSCIAVNSVSNPIPLDCEGIVTASFPGLENSIVGFSDVKSNAYKICPIDGTFQLLCSSYGNCAGAANIRLPIQSPLPTSCEDILPIHFLDFSYLLINKTVSLKWETAAEVNSKYFLIERSSDGINFSTIDKQSAAGNSNSLNQYAFIDNNPASINYYRLKEVDIDSTISYSKILFVKVTKGTALKILQNPAQDKLQLQINTNQSQLNQISILDFTGRRLKSLNLQQGLKDIDISFLSAGIYVLQLITSDGQIFSNHFIKAQ